MTDAGNIQGPLHIDRPLGSKRRVLRKLRITEISAVDNPCQEYARMVIMKRAPIERVQTRDQRLLGVKVNLAILKARLLKANPIDDDLIKSKQDRIEAARRIFHHPNTSSHEKEAARAALGRMGATVGNPYHDAQGRFSSGSSTGSSSARTYYSGGDRFRDDFIRWAQQPRAARGTLEEFLAEQRKKGPRGGFASNVSEEDVKGFEEALKRAKTYQQRVQVIDAIVNLVILGTVAAHAAHVIPHVISGAKYVGSKIKEGYQYLTKAEQLRLQASIKQATDKITKLAKANSNHDQKGRFAPKDGGASSKEESKPSKLRQIGRKLGTVAAGVAAVGAATWFALPHIFSIIDKINAGPDLTPRQVSGIVKYAMSNKRSAAESFVNKVQTGANIPHDEAIKRVLKATEDMIALRKDPDSIRSYGLRSSTFNIPRDAAKSAPKEDQVLVGLQNLLEGLKELKA